MSDSPLGKDLVGGDRCIVKLEVDYTRGGHHGARNHCKVMRSPVLEPRKEKTVWSRLKLTL